MTKRQGTSYPEDTIPVPKKPKTGDEIEPGVYLWYGQKVDKKTLDAKISLENQEREWAKEAKSSTEDHQHKFILPVEWQEYPMRTTTIKIKKVTKLRCDCGQEIKR